MEEHVFQQLKENDVEDKIEWMENEIGRDSLDEYDDIFESEDYDTSIKSYYNHIAPDDIEERSSKMWRF